MPVEEKKVINNSPKLNSELALILLTIRIPTKSVLHPSAFLHFNFNTDNI
jgi:hypothetical protein